MFHDYLGNMVSPTSLSKSKLPGWSERLATQVLQGPNGGGEKPVRKKNGLGGWTLGVGGEWVA